MRFKPSRLASLLLLGVSAPVFSQTTICKVEGDSIGPEMISWDTNQRDQPVTVPSLPAYVVLKLASGDRRLDQLDLEAIQQELVAALQRQVPEADYAILAEEARQAAFFIGPDHVGRIGLWTLQVRTGEPALVRQQLPRAPVMLSHIAHLTEKDGRWSVQSVAVEKLRGR